MAEKRDFNRSAPTWDEEPRRLKLAREVADAIIAAAKPTREMDALDFGCGTGLLTLCLHPHLRSITGVDNSGRMLEMLERKDEEQWLSNVQTAFFDIAKGERPPGRYHLIVSSMALHHVEDIPALFRAFADLLHPGGQLCVADLDREDGSFHDNPVGVVHFGFDRAELLGMLTDAGFVEIRATTATSIHKSSPARTRDYPVFLISGRKTG